MLTDSLFTDASWLFFAIWSIVIGTISVAAFGHDVLGSKARVTSSHRASTPTARNNGAGQI
jgi:hypothetical protein